MKSVSLFLLLAVCTASHFTKAQTSGGPDAFGYIWLNDQDSLGPAFHWKNIKDTSNLISGLGDDNAVGPFNFGFNFRYYGIDYDSIWIGSNGWISFQPLGSIGAPFATIPAQASPNNFIAGMLSDLTFITSTSIPVPGTGAYIWTNHVDSAIIQYDSIPFWVSGASGYSGRNTFQIILNGTDHSITFHYKHQMNDSLPYDLSGEGLKTGIENITGQIGLQVRDTFPSDSSSVKFFYPNTFSTNTMDNSSLFLEQNYPNPGNDFTTIRYSIKRNENVQLSIQNLIGEQVDLFSIENAAPGNHSIGLPLQKYAPGVYFYTLSIREVTDTRKMIIMK